MKLYRSFAYELITVDLLLTYICVYCVWLKLASVNQQNFRVLLIFVIFTSFNICYLIVRVQICTFNNYYDVAINTSIGYSVFYMKQVIFDECFRVDYVLTVFLTFQCRI